MNLISVVQYRHENCLSKMYFLTEVLPELAYTIITVESESEMFIFSDLLNVKSRSGFTIACFVSAAFNTII